MRICSNGCGRKYYARGLCKRCYTSAWSKGAHKAHPREIVAAGATLDERLRHHGWTEVDHGWTAVDTPCWEWCGSLRPDGYGQLAVGRFRAGDPKNTVPMKASVAAYRAWVGAVPHGMAVCHRCDNPPCINPSHLFLGTSLQNISDMVIKGRHSNGENKGQHKLTDEQVDHLRARYSAGGVTQRALAGEFGVSQQLVSHLVRWTRRKTATRPKALGP